MLDGHETLFGKVPDVLTADTAYGVTRLPQGFDHFVSTVGATVYGCNLPIPARGPG